jgi:plastocyanin
VSKQRTRTRNLLASALVGIALVASACGGGDSGGSAAPAAGGGTTVAMKLIAFSPERLTVPAGTAVTWKNDDATEHTVTSGKVNQASAGVTTAVDGMFESGSMKQNATFSFTFTTPGTYSYFCKLHPATMRGEITVT